MHIKRKKEKKSFALTCKFCLFILLFSTLLLSKNVHATPTLGEIYDTLKEKGYKLHGTGHYLSFKNPESPSIIIETHLKKNSKQINIKNISLEKHQHRKIKKIDIKTSSCKSRGKKILWRQFSWPFITDKTSDFLKSLDNFILGIPLFEKKRFKDDLINLKLNQVFIFNSDKYSFKYIRNDGAKCDGMGGHYWLASFNFK